MAIVDNKDFSPTSGEGKTRRFLELYFDFKKKTDLYVQQFFCSSLRPDFLIMDPTRGLLVIEVKDWDSETVKEFSENLVVLKENSQEATNPLYQLDRYVEQVKIILEKHFYDPRQDELLFPVHGLLVFPHEERKSFLGREMDKFQKNGKKGYGHLPILYREDLTRKQKENGPDIWKKIFPPCLDLSEKEVGIARGVLFPYLVLKNDLKDHEVATAKREGKLNEVLSKVALLDREQEEYARQKPEGARLLTGVPGSGKTVILRSRAAYILTENPESKVALLTYTTALDKDVEQWKRDYARANGPVLKNLESRTFHGWLLSLTHGGRQALDQAKKSGKQSEFWDSQLAEMFLSQEKIPEPYDAILVDEYQDFQKIWFEVIKRMIKPKGHLFFAGDVVQRIWKRDWKWIDMGFEFRGGGDSGQRSKRLRKSYRTRLNHLMMALDFLKGNEKRGLGELRKEVEDVYPRDVIVDPIEPGKIVALEGSYREVYSLLEDLVKKEYSSSDILVLALNQHMGKDFIKQLLPFPSLKGKFFWQTKQHRAEENTITYHSSKGLESPVVILLDVDQIHHVQFNGGKDLNEVARRKLLYVGMTRASQRLYLHAHNFSDGFAGELWKLFSKVKVEFDTEVPF